MKQILEDWLAEDVGKGDFTSQAVVENSPCKALVTGGPGIISGIQICKELLVKSNIKFKAFFDDGDNIDSETSIFELEGNAHDILKTERLFLNILSHLSGIATFTHSVVMEAKKANPNVEILATRKTIPGLRVLEKEAVLHGGGKTHRFRLDDAILIKDNHLKLANNIYDAVSQSRLKFPDLMIEVEADTPEQAIEAAKADADRVMLDNFTPELARKTIERLKQISDIEIEISGGINLENITEYSPYSNLISLSGLTMSAPPVDFSLHVI